MILSAVLIGALARPGRALEYEANLGFGRTDASTSRGAVGPRANGRFGLGMLFAVSERWSFATGTDYVLRRVIWRRDDGVRLSLDFDYVDLPALWRYRANRRFDAYAGVRVGIEVSNKIETPRGTPDVDAGARGFPVFAEAGARVHLTDRWAFAAFIEREIDAGFAARLSALRTLGGRVDYAF